MLSIVQIYRQELERAIKEDRPDSAAFVGAAFKAHADTVKTISREPKLTSELDTLFGGFLDHNLSQRFTSLQHTNLREKIWVIDVLAWDVYLRALYNEEYWGVRFEVFMQAQGIDYPNLLQCINPDHCDIGELVFSKPTVLESIDVWKIIIDGWHAAETRLLKKVPNKKY